MAAAGFPRVTGCPRKGSAFIRRGQSKNNVRQFSTSCPHQPRQADYLARAYGEAHVGYAGWTVPAATEFQHHLTQLNFTFGKHRRQLAPNHRLNQVRATRLRHQSGFDRATVSQHRYSIRDQRQLFQAMRNVDNPDAVFAQLPQNFEEVVRVLLRECRRRLVKN